MDEYIIKTYGAENLDKIKRNLNNGPAESKRRFLVEYPGADTSKFEFSSVLTRTGDIDRYTVSYKTDGGSYDITSDTFRNSKDWVWYLYQWSKIWSIYGTVQPYTVNPIRTRYDVTKFKVYVNSSQFFDSILPELSIDDNTLSDGDDDDDDDIETNSHLASVYAAYIASYLCGICTKHLWYNSETPGIITSIARYHMYYHMSRFIRDPSKMKRYITDDVKKIIVNNKPTEYDWKDAVEFVFFKGSEVEVEGWVSRQPPGSVKDAVFKISPAGPVIEYKKRRGWTIDGSLDDYKLFIATESNGLTKSGQLLLQMSIESYVYCVLGSQAKTRWPIVGRGAMSIQTQSVFSKLVFDTIAQDDHTIAVSNMRRAIKDTNVILNMAVSPGIILVPSDMTILTEMIPGYNNVLTLAGGNMKFGVNTAVNYLKPIDRKNTETKTNKGKSKTSTDDALGDLITDGRYVNRRAPSSYGADIYLAIIALTGGVLVSKYVL